LGPARRVWVAGGVLATTPLFAVRDVRVTGTAVLEPSDVAATADDWRDGPLMRADLDAIAAEVAALPAVKAVDVSRSWPSALTIAVTEREPYLAVPKGERFLMVDDAGVVFHETEDPDGAVWIAELGSPGPDDLATVETLAALAGLPDALAGQVETVAAPSPASVTLNLSDGRTLRWGDGSENDKKARVALRLLARGYEHVDVSAPDAPSVS
jgi:cell division protein FtsQ